MTTRGHHGLLLGAGATADLATTILAQSPWAYYQMGESAPASSYADSSGNARNLGNVVATVTAGSTALVSPGTSADFDGNGYVSSTSNQYGTAQATAFDGNKAVSYTVVLNIDSLASSRVPVHMGNTSVSNSQGVFIQVLTTGALRFQFYDTVSAGFKNFDSATGVISAGTTYIIHARRNTSGGAALFVNGSSVATSASMTGNIAMAATAASGGQRIILGALNASTPSTKMDGRLQHVAIFNYALSDANIIAQYVSSGL